MSASQNIVVVGDRRIGKTCLVELFATPVLPDGFVPTVFDSFTAEVVVENQQVQLDLRDTAGAENHDRLRPLSYRNANVVVICFSVSQRSSYESVERKWIKEIRYHLHKVPVILVGTMMDSRPVDIASDDEEKFITTEMGQQMARRIEASAYLECSAHGNRGVKEVFEEAARVAISSKKEKKKRCCLMQ